MQIFKRILIGMFGLVVLLFILLQVPAVQDQIFKSIGPRLLNVDYGDSQGLRVFVCGSASPLGNSPDRAQACIAIVTPDHFYVFDSGAGSASTLQTYGLPLQRLDGVFLTHFHSDHIADLSAVKLSSWVVGRPYPLKVIGPVGVEKVVDGFNLAYELDNQYRTAHHGEALLPLHLAKLEARAMNDGVVLDDNGLRVTMFQVGHEPIHPAVGYKIEYAGRKVVVSGDSIVVQKTFEMAQDADLLFHDALSRDALDPMIEVAQLAGRDRLTKIMTDVIDYHADAQKVETASKNAGVKQLVLYHMVPTPVNFLLERLWRRNLSDDTILAVDGMTFTLERLE